MKDSTGSADTESDAQFKQRVDNMSLSALPRCLNATYEKYKERTTGEDLATLESGEFLKKMKNPFMFKSSDILGQAFIKDVKDAIISEITASFTSDEDINRLQELGFTSEQPREETDVEDAEFVFDGGGRKRRKKRSTKKKRSKKRRSRTRRRRR
jgi:hypothetical protein